MTLRNWSYSLLTVFESCKHRVKLARVDKIPDNTPRPNADRGTMIHQEAEDYVRGKAPITHNLRHFANDLLALAAHFKAGRVVCEEEWAFTDNWEITDWKSGWLRLKCDAVVHLSGQHLAVVDYKTGKRFGNEIKHAEQLQLYALCALIRYPNIEEVTCELWYLDQNELASFHIKRKSLSRFLGIFDRRGRAITTEKEFKPNPNIISCKYCPYSPEKQGDCQFGVRQDGTKSVVKVETLRLNKKPMKSDALFSEKDLEGL